MVLSRTMTLAFVPGGALAACSCFLIGGCDRRRQSVNLALGAITALLVAAPWYVKDAREVYHYLIGTGYGASSAAYGPGSSMWSVQYWTKDFALILQHLYLALGAALLLCLVVALIPVAGRLKNSNHPDWRLSWLASDSSVLVIAVVSGYLALTSSRNTGTGFSLPLLPPLVVLVVTATASIPWTWTRRCLAALLVLITISTLVMKSGYDPALAQYREAVIPVIGRVPISDGRGLIQLEVAGAGYSIGSPTTPFPSLERKWLPLSLDVAREIDRRARAHSQRQAVMFGTDDLLFNDTRLELASALWLHTDLPGNLLKPFPNGDSVASYRSQMIKFGSPFLVTAQPNGREDFIISQPKVQAAARSLGFEVVRRFRLPDGRGAALWWKAPSRTS